MEWEGERGSQVERWPKGIESRFSSDAQSPAPGQRMDPRAGGGEHCQAMGWQLPSLPFTSHGLG